MLAESQEESRMTADGSDRVRKNTFFFALLVILMLTSLRLVHLEADTPSDLTKDSKGIYVDEGYKTLSPRNLALFGDTKWHPGDDFPGWMDPGTSNPRYRYSPLTQWPFYLAFRILGPHLGSVRLVSVLLFALFLVGFVYATAKSYSRGLLILGLVLLGLQSSLFFYSRLALFVTPVVVCLYWMLFLIRRLEPRPFHLTFAVILVSSIVMTFGVRSSAPVYLAPAVLGVLTSWWIKNSKTDAKRIWTLAGLAAIGIILLASLSYPIWGHRIFKIITYKNVLSNNLLNPLYAASTAVVVAGFLCALHVLLTQPLRYLAHSYRACLLAIVLLGPIPLSIFTYQPLRYYIPFLPAFLLLIFEWIQTRAWQHKIPDRVPWAVTTLCLGILMGVVCCVAHGINEQVLKNLDLVLGNQPGLSRGAMLTYIMPLSIPIGLCLWIFKRRLFQGKAIAGIIACSLLFTTLRDISSIGKFFTYPSYRSREISAALREIVPEGGTIGGDWAPFFALGTDLKALFINRNFNKPSRTSTLQADYFLFCETDENLELMHDFEDIVVEPPVYVSSYMEFRVALHRLKW